MPESNAWYCGQCGYGPMIKALYAACLSCGHVMDYCCSPTSVEDDSATAPARDFGYRHKQGVLQDRTSIDWQSMPEEKEPSVARSHEHQDERPFDINDFLNDDFFTPAHSSTQPAENNADDAHMPLPQGDSETSIRPQGSSSTMEARQSDLDGNEIMDEQGLLRRDSQYIDRDEAMDESRSLTEESKRHADLQNPMLHGTELGSNVMPKATFNTIQKKSWVHQRSVVPLIALAADLRRLCRPRIAIGHTRLEWICTCNKSRYGDYACSDAEKLEAFRSELRDQPTACIDHDVENDSQPTDAGHSGSSHSSSVSELMSRRPTSTARNPPYVQTGQMKGSFTGVTQSGDCVSCSVAGLHPEPRFFELCVDIDFLHVRLGEINLGPRQALGNGSPFVQTDAELFKRIKSQYDAIRSNVWSRFLYKPANIQFVQFHLTPGAANRIGMYGESPAIPPVDEVKQGNYHYHECPLNIMPPIDRRTFLHYMNDYKSHEKPTQSLFLNRLPKKLRDSMLRQCQQDSLNLGWGVHVIEGPNKPLVSMIVLAIIVLSFVVSVLYAVIAGSSESGFGIGQWLVACLSAALAALYFHLAEA